MPDAFLGAGAGDPVELNCRSGAVQCDVPRLTRPGWCVFRLNRRSSRGVDDVKELDHGGWGASADVEHSLGAGVARRSDEGVDDVSNIDVVTGLLAVTVDGGSLTASHLATEDSNYSCLATRVLPGAVDVGEPQSDVAP